MTDYVFDASASTQERDWDDPASWYGGVVPDAPDADVSFPTVTDTADGDVYASFVAIQSGEGFAVQSVTVTNNFIELSGTLSIAGALDLETGGEIDLAGGTLTFGSLTNGGTDIQGYGRIETAGTLDNTGLIIGGGGATGLVIDAASFRNTGTILAGASNVATASSPTTTVTIDAASDADFAGGTLGGGGTYEAIYGGILDLNLGGVITTDAATLEIQKADSNGLTGQIDSLDPISGTYRSLQSTLTTVAAPGRLIVDNTTYATSNAFTVAGELTLAATGGGPGGFAAPSLTVAAGGTIDGTGTVTAPILNDGVIVSDFPAADDPATGAQPGDLTIDGTVTGTGTLEVGAGLVTTIVGIRPPMQAVERSVLELAGATAQSVLFADDTGHLVLDDPASFSGTLTTQAPGAFADLLTLDNIALSDVTSYGYVGDASGGTLTIAEGRTTQTLRFAGSHQTSDFTLSAGPQTLSNSPPSLDISIACYARGTLIRTDRGNVPVEALRIGDRVATVAGPFRPIRWIGRRAYGGRFLAANRGVRPILFRAGSLGRYQPARDLRVSPKHAMFLDGCLVPAECLVDGRHVVVDTACREVEYHHVELDSHDILLAEDTPSESFVDDGSRAMFHNAHEHVALYPDRPQAPVAYCALRVENGPRLERIRQALGLTPDDACRLRGHLDDAGDGTLRGWAQDPDRPEVPVCLEILVDGAVLGHAVANLFRADLAEAGLGSGRHGFAFALPDTAGGAALEVRRAGDHAPLGLAA